MIALCLACLPVQANDTALGPTINDPQIELWVDRAPLELFVAELATTIGRQVDIDSALSGQVSGRFSGSLNDTLTDVGSRFSLLFDLNDNTLGAAPASSRSNASVALNDVKPEALATQAFMETLLPGNTVELRDDVFMVSGHPSFVRRTARLVSSAISQLEKTESESEFTLDLALDEDINAQVVVDRKEPAFAEESVEAMVVDSASKAILDEVASEPSSEEQQALGAARKIEWVTDIPGFNTF